MNYCIIDHLDLLIDTVVVHLDDLKCCEHTLAYQVLDDGTRGFADPTFAWDSKKESGPG